MSERADRERTMLEPLSDGDSLTEAIRAFIRTHGLRDEIEQEQGPSGYTTLLRRRGPIRRHLLIRTLGEAFANHYGVVWGEYPS